MSAVAAGTGTAAENAAPGPDVQAQTAPPPADTGWVWQVTLLSVALGVLLALAIRTTEHIRSLGLPNNRFGVSAATLSRYKEKNEDLQREIEQRREQVSQFEIRRQTGSRASDLLRKQLQDYQAELGLAAVKGPGLEITLRDSPVHMLAGTAPTDYLASFRDVNSLVSELWASGAEAVAVGGGGSEPLQRFVVSTTVRPVPAGRGILLNGHAFPPPYRIRVIGNPKDLYAALRMPEGIIQQSGLEVLKMITIKESQHLVLPAFTDGHGSGRPAPKQS